MHQDLFRILDGAVLATGIGRAINVADYRHIVMALSAVDATGTIKFQGSIQKEMPDFAAAQAPDNLWDYVKVIDLEDSANIDGDTGIVLSNTTDVRQFEVNTNAIVWLNVIVSGTPDGAAYVDAFARGLNK